MFRHAAMWLKSYVFVDPKTTLFDHLGELALMEY